MRAGGSSDDSNSDLRWPTTFRRSLALTGEVIIDSADELRGLSASLEGLSALETRAGPAMLREAAVGVRAASMQSFITACRTAGISARLHAWPDVVAIVDPPDSGDVEESSAE